jgi:hypothetical protein
MSSSFNAHKSLPALLSGVGLFLISNGSRVWIDSRTRETSGDPVSSAVWALLRLFTTEYFGENSGYRSTVFLPGVDGRFLQPTVRYQYGVPFGKVDSRSKFLKGQALAGFAWNRPEKAYMRDNIGPFATDSEFLTYCRSDLQMQHETVRLLSDHVRHHVRGIYCTGLVDRTDNFLGVLSIDSMDDNAFARMSTEKIQRFRAVLAATLEARNNHR